MLKRLDKQLLCELLFNNVFCLAFSSNFLFCFYLGLCIRYLWISGYFAGPWRWTFKYIFIIWNLEFSTYSTYVYNTMIIYTVRTTCLHVHTGYSRNKCIKCYSSCLKTNYVICSVGNSHRLIPTCWFSSILCLWFEIQGKWTYNFFEFQTLVICANLAITLGQFNAKWSWKLAANYCVNCLLFAQSLMWLAFNS